MEFNEEPFLRKFQQLENKFNVVMAKVMENQAYTGRVKALKEFYMEYEDEEFEVENDSDNLEIKLKAKSALEKFEYFNKEIEISQIIDEVQEQYMKLYSEIVAKGNSTSPTLKAKANETSDKMSAFGKKEIIFLAGTDWKDIRDKLEYIVG